MTERLIGLRNIICTKEDWYYLVFYDIDKPLTQKEIDIIDLYCEDISCSYLLYKTKHGCHFVGLSPFTAVGWAYLFDKMKIEFNSYYSGNVIRLSRKKDEIQELIVCNTTYGEVIPNLYNLYCDRFNLKKMPWNRETSRYLLVFEKYRSMKE